MTNNLARIADKVMEKSAKAKAKELRKALAGNQTVIVTLHTGSIYTFITIESKTGLRFSGIRNGAGQRGRFHASMIKDVQTFAFTKGKETVK